jgi:hypothetical protein
MAKIKRLQVKIGDSWEYVFCRNELKKDPIITKNPKIALRAFDLDYFKNKFANHEFRISE